MVGEHTLAESPDCRKEGRFCLPEPQELEIEKVDQHPQWNKADYKAGFDIALVRVKGNIKLFVSVSIVTVYHQ